MSRVIYRKNNDDEWKQITEVYMQSFFKEPLKAKQQKAAYDRVKLLIENNITTFIVAENTGLLIGISGITNHISSSFIGYVAVIPTFRNMGIGTNLFDISLQEALKHNPTVELFANPGPDKIYQHFGFQEEYRTNIYNLTKIPNEKNHEFEIITKTIPNWVLKLDKETMGFDRAKFLKVLVAHDYHLLLAPKKGFVFFTDAKIGPCIAKKPKLSVEMIKHIVSIKGNIDIVLPEMLEQHIQIFSPIKKNSCIKMCFGKPIRRILPRVWSFESFATG